MNTFGASAYLKAEREAVSETLQTLQERLRKLKMEELSIRAEIRYNMAAAAGGPAAGDSATAGGFSEPTNRKSRVWTQNPDAQRRQGSTSHEADEVGSLI